MHQLMLQFLFSLLPRSNLGNVLESGDQSDGAGGVVAKQLTLPIDNPHRTIRAHNAIFERGQGSDGIRLMQRRFNPSAVVWMDEVIEILLRILDLIRAHAE